MNLKRMGLAAVLLPLLLSAAPAEQPFTLAENGKAQCVISLPENASRYDRLAAEDLKYYLGKITGGDFQVVSEKDVKGKAICLGESKAAKKDGLKDFQDEEWCISSPDGKRLILTGARPIGGFYAAWSLLNRLGCYALTWDQDAFPQDKNLVYQGGYERRKPAFAGRLIYDGYPHQFRKIDTDKKVTEAYVRWLLRSRINGEQSKRLPSLYTYGSYHMAQPYPYHTLDLFVPPEKYFKTHPEYFAMNEQGKRFPPERPHVGGSLCMSNPEVARVALETLREMIRADRSKNPKEEWAYVYDISKLDRMPYICKCPNCLAIIKEEGTETGLHMRFINAVAREIRKEYPDIIIRTNGNVGANPPPTKTLPESNVLVWVTDRFTVSDPFRPIEHPVNEEAKAKHFEIWKGKAKQMCLWDYWNLGGAVYFNPPRVETVFDAIQSDFRYFRSIGISDIFIEASRDRASPQNFIDATYFVANNLMVNPDDDPEKLADIFFKYYYGPAAPVLKKWFDEIRAGIKKHPGKQPTLGVGVWCYADASFIFNSYMMLKKTAESLPKGSPYRDRVEWERTSVVWYILAHRPDFRGIFARNGMNVNDLVAECRALVKSYIRRYPSRKPAVFEKEFEERFKNCSIELKRPEKFKDVPEEDFRMVAYPYFRKVAQFNAAVVDDPDSIQGRAVKSAPKGDVYHGVDKVMPGRGHFRTTYFQLRNDRTLGGAVSLRLKKVPQDEKYHWFRMPGSIELKHKSAFWGHGWAIQVPTTHLYMLTDGTASDNTWDEVWFSAKFTGPAYVPGSKKENAIWLDMLVLTRKGKKK